MVIHLYYDLFNDLFVRAHSSHPKVVAEYLDCRILHLIALLDSCHSNVHQDPQVSVTWQHKLKNKHSAQQSTKFGSILLCFIIKKRKRSGQLYWHGHLAVITF